MIQLQKVSEKNLWKIVKLSVKEDQNNFVATNTQSILQAYVALSEGTVALPFGIYDNEELIGFVMFGYDSSNDENEPQIATKNYCIWRFMIADSHQGKGYGKLALHKAIEYLRSAPCGKAEYCWLSYEPENIVAKNLYLSYGFQENGEMCEDEIVAVLKL